MTIVCLNIIKEIYKKTLAYELEQITFDNKGNMVHLHSNKFLEEHPERIDLPEFTIEEELEQLKFVTELSKIY